MDFEKDISLKWKNKTMSKPTTPMEDRRTHYADNWSKMNFESLEVRVICISIIATTLHTRICQIRLYSCFALFISCVLKRR